jgi:hypothetical protein
MLVLTGVGMRRSLALVCGCLVGALSLSPAGAATDEGANRLARIPHAVLWAWERPEDLRELGDAVGVAFLAQTITLGVGTFEVTPRRQPLRVSPGARLVAVTRIESGSSAASSSIDDGVIGSIADVVARTTALPQVVAVQVDYDAVRSERSLYARLLRRVRTRLDRSTALTITALASWCIGDRWLEQLPVDEAVAMLFRLGPLNEPYVHIAQSRASVADRCNAVGMSLDEPIPLRRDGRRVYVFSPQPWTPQTIALADGAAR